MPVNFYKCPAAIPGIWQATGRRHRCNHFDGRRTGPNRRLVGVQVVMVIDNRTDFPSSKMGPGQELTINHQPSANRSSQGDNCSVGHRRQVA